MREICIGGMADRLKFPFILVKHIEWWSGIFKFQYSSNTSLLFWVFNQSIGTWLIIILFLQLRTNKNSQALSSLTFAYSSWAVFGMIPISLASIFHDGRKFKSVLTFQNIAVPIMIGVFYGIFYLSSNGSVSTSMSGFTLKKFEDFVLYAFFILTEFGIFFLIMGRKAMSYNFYYVVLAELLLIPLYVIVAYDFIMRASIPALFILMTFLIKFLLDDNNKTKKIILVIVMIIEAATPIIEINRSIGVTLLRTWQGRRSELLREEIHSYGDISTKQLLSYHFFIPDYEHSIFYKISR